MTFSVFHKQEQAGLHVCHTSVFRLKLQNKMFDPCVHKYGI